MAKEQRQQGKNWEELFETLCQLAGMYPEKNHPQFQFLPRYRTRTIKGNLDWTLIWPQAEGVTKIGFFDTKSFKGPTFNYSDIDKDQIRRANTYNQLGVSAGFVIYFVTLNSVVFFEGSLISRGMGSSFGIEKGVLLGRLDTADLSKLFAPPTPVPVMTVQD